MTDPTMVPASSAWPTFPATGIAFPPAAVISATTFSQASRWREHTATCAPAPAMASAMARPMPLLPP